MSEEPAAVAVIAALNAANAKPYDLDDVPDSPGAYYTEVTVSRRFGGVMRGEQPTSTLLRVTTRAVGNTVGNAREVRRRAASALEGKSLTINGVPTTPIQFESEETIGLDDGYYSGLTLWTFTL